jgi:hypothetical protein
MAVRNICVTEADADGERRAAFALALVCALRCWRLDIFLIRLAENDEHIMCRLRVVQASPYEAPAPVISLSGHFVVERRLLDMSDVARI